ncbi:MAG: Coenzyme F420 hydrogenase/dehydrogenase, beta subunit C-terminal domain [Ruminococcus sp.]|nr:Coenzyme F420 hydrogenase/dehydrogenase, beta subunit C-terminal domain [Ruminococcus sp.]
MVSIIDKYSCCGCGACKAKCPKNCIEMVPDSEGFDYPVVNTELCISCGICDSVCPVHTESEFSQALPVAYAAFSKEDKVLFDSSSGGVFYHVSKWILENNGVVIGAAYTGDFKVEHICVDNFYDLIRLQGSKYVQSSTCDSYIQTLEYLKKGLKVLYSGTPCQIEGLYSFLGKDYDNLYTVDIICSGVPSPLIWERYLTYRKNKAKSRLNSVNLRYKKYGWQEYIILFEFENGKVYECTRFEDHYMRAFRTHCSLRPSCYRCKFKGIKRNSDITVADFWGIERILPDMNNKKGTSLLFLQSQKGKDLFNNIVDYLKVVQVDTEKAAECNPMMTYSAKEPTIRNEFFAEAEKSVIKASNRYCALPLRQKIGFVYQRIRKNFFNI